jgi:hypothetical protein
MKKQYIIFLFILFISCSGEVLVNRSAAQNQSSSKKYDITGHWKFVYAVKEQGTPFLKIYPNPNTPAYEVGPPEPPYIGPDFIFEGDSAYQLEYPIYMCDKDAYSIDSGYLHFNHKWAAELFPIEWRDDTLFIYKPFYDDEYIKEAYIRTSFDDSIIHILKNNPANYPELPNTWYLVRSSSGGDGSFYELDFPHKLPDSILISRQQFIAAIHNNNNFQVLTDGKLRNYTFVFSYGSLHFTAGKWYKGKDPWIHFESIKTEY